MRIVIDDKIPFIKGVLEPFADVVYLPGSVFAHGNIQDADALIIRTRTKCNEALLSGTSVRFIATATIGYDHIDTAWCEANGIHWTNAPGCNSGSVRQYIASAFATLSSHFGFRFDEMTLGVIGVGNVGSKVAALGETLGMTVLRNDPPRARNEGLGRFVPLNEILEMSDIISLHVPLNRTGHDKTFHLFDEPILSSLPHRTILINSSRGEVVDNLALKKILLAKKIGASVLDVWENEPDIDLDLLPLLNIATPHIAGYSADGKANGTAMSVQALSRLFGLPLDNWYPPVIPQPEQPLTFELDCIRKSLQQCVCEAIWHTYSINDDDGMLRMNPGTFEKQRGNYPVRREFEAFSIRLKHEHTDIGSYLYKLGFNIL